MTGASPTANTGACSCVQGGEKSTCRRRASASLQQQIDTHDAITVVCQQVLTRSCKQKCYCFTLAELRNDAKQVLIEAALKEEIRLHSKDQIIDLASFMLCAAVDAHLQASLSGKRLHAEHMRFCCRKFWRTLVIL